MSTPTPAPKAASPIPTGYSPVTPYVTIAGAERVIEFLTAAFGAEVHHLSRRPDGSIQHCDLLVHGAHLMLSEANDTWKARPTGFYFYVVDTDAAYQAALSHGAVSLMEPTETSYGDRNAGVVDPGGNHWWIATRVDDLAAQPPPSNG